MRFRWLGGHHASISGLCRSDGRWCPKLDINARNCSSLDRCLTVAIVCSVIVLVEGGRGARALLVYGVCLCVSRPLTTRHEHSPPEVTERNFVIINVHRLAHYRTTAYDTHPSHLGCNGISFCSSWYYAASSKSLLECSIVGHALNGGVLQCYSIA